MNYTAAIYLLRGGVSTCRSSRRWWSEFVDGLQGELLIVHYMLSSKQHKPSQRAASGSDGNSFPFHIWRTTHLICHRNPEWATDLTRRGWEIHQAAVVQPLAWLTVWCLQISHTHTLTHPWCQICPCPLSLASWRSGFSFRLPPAVICRAHTGGESCC